MRVIREYLPLLIGASLWGGCNTDKPLSPDDDNHGTDSGAAREPIRGKVGETGTRPCHDFGVGASAVMAASHDGNLVAVGGSAGVIWVLNAQDGGAIRRLEGQGDVTDLEFLPDDRLASVSIGGPVRFWSARGGTLLREIPLFPPDRSNVDWIGWTQFAFAADGTRFAVTGPDRKLRILSTADGRVLSETRLQYPQGGTGFFRFPVAISRNGALAAVDYYDYSGSDSDGALIIRTKDGSVEQKVVTRMHTSALEFSADASALALAMWKTTNGKVSSAVQLARVADGSLSKAVTLSDPGSAPYGLAFSPAADMLAVAATEGAALIRLGQENTVVQVDLPTGASAVRLSADEKGFWFSKGDGSLGLFDLQTLVRQRWLTRHVADGPVALTPDGEFLATGGILWRTDSWSQHIKVGDPATSAAFSSDGTLVAVNGPDGLSMFRTRDAAKLYGPNNLGNSHSRDVVFFPDGKTCAVASDKELLLFRSLDGAVLRRSKRLSLIKSIAISPDGKQIVIGSYASQEVLAWDLDTDSVLAQRISTRGEGGYALAHSPNGRWLAVLNQSDLNLVDAASYSIIWSLPLSKPIYDALSRSFAIRFSPDGEVLVFPDGNSTRLVRVQNGSPVTTWTGQPFDSFSFSHDGSMLAVGSSSNNGVIRVWCGPEHGPDIAP